MTGFDPLAFGDRLRRCLADRGWDVKRLQESVRSKYGKLRGSSYGNVWSYVNGKAPIEPRRELVEAMADLLHVRPEHLLAGGARTEAEKRAASGEPTRHVGSEDVFRRELRYETLHSSARGQLWRLWGTVFSLELERAELRSEPPPDEEEHGVECARRVARALGDPLSRLDLLAVGHGEVAETPGEFFGAMYSSDELDSYIISTCEGLLHLVRAQNARIQRSRDAVNRFRASETQENDHATD